MTQPSSIPTVLITGASSGIGLALARSYAQDRVNLVLNARDAAKLERNLEAYASPERVALVAGDLTDAATAQRLVTCAVERFGRADVLVNNAGVFHGRPLLGFSERDIDAYLDTNLRGTILASQALVAQLRAQNSPGAIVNVTSAISLTPLGGLPASVPNATKGGINTFTRSLALELVREHIRVNAVAPGLIRTPLLGETEADFRAAAALQPGGELGHVSDVVAAVRFLASQPFVTGVVLPVDGGASLGHW